VAAQQLSSVCQVSRKVNSDTKLRIGRRTTAIDFSSAGNHSLRFYIQNDPSALSKIFDYFGLVFPKKSSSSDEFDDPNVH